MVGWTSCETDRHGFKKKRLNKDVFIPLGIFGAYTT